jgi:hypothetical protein
MDTEYMRATSEPEREALARKIADLRVADVPWDGPGGIVDSMRLVSSATQGRKLLRRYGLDAAQGGPVEIRPSYDRYEVNPATGRRKGYRPGARKRARAPGASATRTADAIDKQPSRSAPRNARPREALNWTAASPTAEGREAASDPLIAFAREIARRTGRRVPTPNPDGPTTRALVLFVLRDPGATETSGANETGVLDPYLNLDPTSMRQREALRKAGIDRGLCVWWNASPYHLDYGGTIKPADAADGARYLREFIRLCPRLRVVVAMGASAHAVVRLAWQASEPDLLPLFLAPHPMIYGRGAAQREAELAARLAEAARLLRVPRAQ